MGRWTDDPAYHVREHSMPETQLKGRQGKTKWQTENRPGQKDARKPLTCGHHQSKGGHRLTRYDKRTRRQAGLQHGKTEQRV